MNMSAHDATSQHDTGKYVIAGGTAGRDRLSVLSRVMVDSTLSLLDRVGIPPDARVLDLGCGGGDVTRVFAERAPRGTVVGVDFDPQVIAIAEAETADRQLDNVEFVVGDLGESGSDVVGAVTEAGPFDVVYARFLLSHLADPAALVDRMVEWCAPGGVVVAEDIDIAGSICAPPHGAFSSTCALYAETVRARGGDPQLGLALPVVLDEAGLSDVQVAVAQPGGLRGDAKRIQLLTLESIAPTAIDLGLTTHEEVAELIASLTEHIARADTYVTTARVIQAWGRRAI